MSAVRAEGGAAAPKPGSELFRLLVRSVKDYAIFLLDPTGHVASWNEGAQRIKGYEEHEIVGRHFSAFYPKAAVDSGWPDYELDAAARDGRFEDLGWRVRKDGSLFWADVVITALRDETGTLVGFAKVTRDLTQQRMADEVLRQSEERYRTLVDAVRDYAIYMLDPDGFVVTWNSGAERLKGYRADEIIGKHFSVFYPPERAGEGFPAEELEIARTQGRFEEENWRVRKDGTRFWANVVLSAVYSADGTLQGFSKVTRDITERRRLELEARQLTMELDQRVRQLDSANRDLEQKNREVESFVYSVSHDVRGPLVNLQGFNRELQRSCGELLEITDEEPGIPPQTRERLRRVIASDMCEATGFMDTAVVHLSRIVDALLRLSRLGRVSYEGTRVDVRELVSRVLTAMKGTIQAKRAEILVGELPPVWADASAMEQVFGNLISNALKYGDPSRPSRIEIGGKINAAGTGVTYYVKDNGLGIPATALSSLFTAFQRFHPEAGTGEGMGLAMVRRIIDRHKGAIRVESAPGEGSVFIVDLPNTEREI